MYAITIDIDWAPDFAIDFAAKILYQNKVKCTWFVTHDSPAVQRLQTDYDNLFELGIHPNFLPNTSQGKTVDEIFKFVKNIVPQATALRTHALHQSSLILHKAMTDYEINIDFSLFLPESKNLQAHKIYYDTNLALLRMPYFWEDDEESYRPQKNWNAAHPKLHEDGLKIFNFHPMYIYLNIVTMDGYNQLKKELIAKNFFLNAATEADLQPFVNSTTEGAGTMFENLLQLLHHKSITTFTAKELHEKFA